MYVRIARFEGGEMARIEAEVAEMKGQMDAGRSGQLPPGAPEQARTLMETVKRVVMLADRGSGTTLGITFTETEDDMRRVDQAMNEMSPGEGAGRRTTVETYEVLLDETFS